MPEKQKLRTARREGGGPEDRAVKCRGHVRSNDLVLHHMVLRVRALAVRGGPVTYVQGVAGSRPESDTGEVIRSVQGFETIAFRRKRGILKADLEGEVPAYWKRVGSAVDDRKVQRARPGQAELEKSARGRDRKVRYVT